MYLCVSENHAEGGETMTRTNTELLEERIAQKGLKKRYIAEQVGLSRQGLNNCIKNKAEFRATHMAILCDLLDIDVHEKEAIFFARERE